VTSICLHLVRGDIDVAIAWGPIGGYYAKKSNADLVVVQIPEYANDESKLNGKTYWNISGGVRKKETERRAELEGAIERNIDKIYKIMEDFGIPYAKPSFDDRLDGYERHKK
jgi:mxaJ protein